MVRVAPPDVALIGMVYVPAGVPTVVLVLLLFEQPACTIIPLITAAIAIATNHRRLREMPPPINASPETGNQKA